MRGTFRTVTLERRVIIDLMNAARGVPFVAVRRTLHIPQLAQARQRLRERPAWPAIFAKAFALLAREQPILRTVYLRWPWPHFYEFGKTVAMVVVAPPDPTKGVLLYKLASPDGFALDDATDRLRRAKSAPPNETPFFRRTLAITRLPLPLRRLIWWLGLNIGRQRGNYFGTLLITSVAAFGGGEVEALGSGPFILSYDRVSSNGEINIMIRWDHRVTDAAVIALALTRLEQILETELTAEMNAAVSHDDRAA